MDPSQGAGPGGARPTVGRRHRGAGGLGPRGPDPRCHRRKPVLRRRVGPDAPVRWAPGRPRGPRPPRTAGPAPRRSGGTGAAPRPPEHATRRSLEFACLVGGSFAVEFLAWASGVEQEQILELMDEAVAARLLDRLPEQPGWFRFPHALVRETLVAGLGAVDRLRKAGGQRGDPAARVRGSGPPVPHGSGAGGD